VLQFVEILVPVSEAVIPLEMSPQIGGCGGVEDFTGKDDEDMGGRFPGVLGVSSLGIR